MDMGNGFNGNRKGTGSIDIEALKKGLRQLQPTRLPTKIAVLRELREIVDQMHDIGVPYAEIAAYLSTHTKVEFKEGALKSMMSKLRNEEKVRAEGGVADALQGRNSTDTPRHD